MKRKNYLKTLILLMLLAFCLSACKSENENKIQTETNASSQTESASSTEIEKTGLWEDANYVANTELGEGAKTFTTIVTADGKSVIFTVHTDEKTVGAALIANGLISGDEGEFGLYVKKVNGITADYDINQSYWAFYINGEYAMTGVDQTDIEEGAEYKLEYSK